MTRTELNNKINHVKAIIEKLSARREKYFAMPNQADADVTNKICDCSYKIGVMKSYAARLENKLYSRSGGKNYGTICMGCNVWTR